MLFGMGDSKTAKRVRITWPSGAVQDFSGLVCGRTYSVSEGSEAHAGAPFRERRAIESIPAIGNNELKLHDTWLLEPVPLPKRQAGPGLFVVRESTPELEVFRRYLFDWRTSLKLPFAMLLNESGDAVKVYGDGVPTDAQCKRDLTQLRQFSHRLCLPFRGEYIREPRRDFFKFGAAFLWAGFVDEALPYLQRVLAHTPENPRVLVLVGQIHFQGQRFDEAEKYFRQAHALNPSSGTAMLGLASVAEKRNDLEGASSWYAKALQAEPQSAEAANRLGLAMAKQGRTEQARAYFEQAIASRRDYSDAINNLGVLYTNEGKVNDAIAAFQYGIQATPDEDILYLNLGRLYVKLEQTDKARAIMQELLDRKPENATARQALRDLNGR
jgi:Tfp pilus assembly protein PilF